jgi:Fe-S-cluster containining protein
VPVLALSLHAGFACRRSGACCTAGWPIPVEPDVAAALAASVPGSAGALDRAGSMPDGAAAIIPPQPGGSCPFYLPDSGNRCAIQRQLGHEALPASCRHFPRVALLESDAVRVTLSHFCPTAASMLFADLPGPPAVVADASGIADRHEHSGFDARATILPLLRPGVAMDEADCRRWEDYLLRTLTDPSCDTPEDVLGLVATSADAIRAWTVEQGSLESHVAATLAEGRAAPRGRWTMNLASAVRLFLLAAGAVPAGLAAPGVPADADAADEAWVRPRWRQGPLGRYLAARSFGAWSAYLGDGIRTQVAMLAVGLAAVRVEAVRQAARARRPLDDEMLLGAIRSADLLLHHLSDARALVRSLAAVEHGPLEEALAMMGLEEGP